MAAEPESLEAAERQDTSSSQPSMVGAWCYLVLLCFQRQARTRQMVWIALGLLGFMITVVALVTASGSWGMERRWLRVERPPTATVKVLGPTTPAGQQGRPRVPPSPGRVITVQQAVEGMELAPSLGVRPAPAAAMESAFAAAYRALLDRSGFFVFSNWIVFSIFLSFLMPIWSLSFATDAIGGEREAGTLVWLLTRPLPRSSVYLAKFVALLPWSLGLTVGGFGLLCLAAGKSGRFAFWVYCPAVFWGTLAFTALFHLLGACFRRSAVVGIVYTFFLETLLGNMPGTMKRVSITFYTRCLMFDSMQDYGILAQEKESFYLPIDGWIARLVLVGVTVLLLVAGMAIFARRQYQDLN